MIGLAWLVWRRRRAALLLALGLLVGVALLMVIGGAGLRAGEPPRGTGVAPGFVIAVRTILLVLPGLLGVIAGAGLFGRELERGTHAFALTQSVGRLRWWATGLVVAGLPVAVGVVAVTWLASWALGPASTARPLSPTFFGSSGLVPAGYVLLGFTVSAIAGLLARNALTAVAVGVGVVLVVAVVLATGYRMHYLAPERARVDLAALATPPFTTAQVLERDPVDGAGRPVDPPGPAGCVGPGDPAPCLRAAGASAVDLVYQPASRYWPLQGIEAAILAALSVLALGAGAWGLRRLS